MNKRSMRILGFYQVQHMLVRLAPSRLSKEIARRLKPMSDAEAIDRQLTDTEEAVRCTQTETSTPFGGIVDIRPALEKAKREVTLDSHECIDIWNNLQHYGEISSFLPIGRGVPPIWPNRPASSATFRSSPMPLPRSLTITARSATMHRPS